MAHDGAAMQSLTLTGWGRSMPVGPQVCRRIGLGMLQVGIKGQHEGGPLLYETDPGVAVAVHAALVSFGLSAPAFEVEVVLRQVPGLPSHKQARRTAGHDVAHRLPDGIATLLPLRLQDLKLRLTLRTRTLGRFECCRNRPDLLHVGANGFLCGVDGAQPPVDVAGQPPESVISSPPFFASRLRWSEACTSSKASAIRTPGGCKGPP